MLDTPSYLAHILHIESKSQYAHILKMNCSSHKSTQWVYRHAKAHGEYKTRHLSAKFKFSIVQHLKLSVEKCSCSRYSVRYCAVHTLLCLIESRLMHVYDKSNWWCAQTHTCLLIFYVLVFSCFTNWAYVFFAAIYFDCQNKNINPICASINKCPK